MVITHCNRCGLDWCFRGTGQPVRCGKCKSPYWRTHGGTKGERESVVRRDRKQAIPRLVPEQRPIPNVVSPPRYPVRPLAAPKVDVSPSYYVPAKYRKGAKNG